MILSCYHKKLVGFVLSTKGRLFLTGCVNQVLRLSFLQETYSSEEVENGKGDMFFSHRSSQSRGILILVREQLDFKLLSSKVDDHSRYILLHAMIQNTPFHLINIYAPIKRAEQSVTLDCFNVLGGDLYVTFDPELDGSGRIKKKDSV